MIAARAPRHRPLVRLCPGRSARRMRGRGRSLKRGDRDRLRQLTAARCPGGGGEGDVRRGPPGACRSGGRAGPPAGPGRLPRRHRGRFEVEPRRGRLPTPAAPLEDSTSVGYIGELDPAATRFSRPILDAAGIAQVGGPSGPRGDGGPAEGDPRIRGLGRSARSSARPPQPALGSRSRSASSRSGWRELVAEVLRSPRRHPLAALQHRAELAAEHQVEGEARDRDHGRAAEGAPQRL